jgi:flavin reductase (DIM6/NTAB) family NADH-FMN oxidoreductase RutF
MRWQFATGVTVICARDRAGRYVGFTANSFNSVSLDRINCVESV